MRTNAANGNGLAEARAPLRTAARSGQDDPLHLTAAAYN
jgi:hypothetical protein